MAEDPLPEIKVPKEIKLYPEEVKPVAPAERPTEEIKPLIGVEETAKHVKKEWEEKYKPAYEEIRKFGKKVWGEIQKIKEERSKKELEKIFEEAGIPVIKPKEHPVSKELGIPIL